MIWRAPFKVQHASRAAFAASVAMHAFALIVLVPYSTRPQMALKLGAQNLHPSIEVMLVTEPMATVKTTVARPLPEPPAHSSADRTRQRSTPQAPPQTKLPAPGREVQTESRPIDDAVRDVRLAGNPSSPPTTASTLTADSAPQSLNDNHLSQISAPTVDRPPELQPTQNARPDYAYNPQPDYPMLLREQGVGGVVWLRVWVDSKGQPVEIRLAKGSGYRLLDDAALRAVKQWRFIPARNGEQRLASWVEFPIRFTLNG
jgi:periplasmic protein TonB